MTLYDRLETTQEVLDTRHIDDMERAWDQSYQLLRYVGLSDFTSKQACGALWYAGKDNKQKVQNCLRFIPDDWLECDRHVLVSAMLEIWACRVNDLAHFLGIDQKELEA